ncbi:hypothetical protein V8F06_002456 [Rhypophila decipiens]
MQPEALTKEDHESPSSPTAPSRHTDTYLSHPAFRKAIFSAFFLIITEFGSNLWFTAQPLMDMDALLERGCGQTWLRLKEHDFRLYLHAIGILIFSFVASSNGRRVSFFARRSQISALTGCRQPNVYHLE